MNDNGRISYDWRWLPSSRPRSFVDFPPSSTSSSFPSSTTMPSLMRNFYISFPFNHNDEGQSAVPATLVVLADEKIIGQIRGEVQKSDIHTNARKTQMRFNEHGVCSLQDNADSVSTSNEIVLQTHGHPIGYIALIETKKGKYIKLTCSKTRHQSCIQYNLQVPGIHKGPISIEYRTPHRFKPDQIGWRINKLLDNKASDGKEWSSIPPHSEPISPPPPPSPPVTSSSSSTLMSSSTMLSKERNETYEYANDCYGKKNFEEAYCRYEMAALHGYKPAEDKINEIPTRPFLLGGSNTCSNTSYPILRTSAGLLSRNFFTKHRASYIR